MMVYAGVACAFGVADGSSIGAAGVVLDSDTSMELGSSPSARAFARAAAALRSSRSRRLRMASSDIDILVVFSETSFASAKAICCFTSAVRSAFHCFRAVTEGVRWAVGSSTRTASSIQSERLGEV